MSETNVSDAIAQMPANPGQSQRYSTTASPQAGGSFSDKQGIIAPAQTDSMTLQVVPDQSSAFEFQPSEYYRIPDAVTVNEALVEEQKIEDIFAQNAHGNCIECGASLFPPESREITCFCRRTIKIGNEGTLVPQGESRENPAILEICPATQSGKTEQENAWLVKGNGSMGLANSGLTCYFNSALNSLYFVPQFHSLFSAEKLPSDSLLIFLLKRFVRIYGQGNVHPSLLTSIRWKIPSFRHEGMGSAYEFILNLLQRANEDVGWGYVEMESVPPGETWEKGISKTEIIRLSAAA